ncbi:MULTISPECIES: OmpH family outer membrane protein [Tenacibaculum]|uniref:OmpH family outer membrane protein n=1 Tax=Tenacibaculum TaxID=104267 RepID=UPI001F0ABDE4|nr:MULTISPECIES: OmpH family outer membrane protein [Tenacibaculum]MCH3880980.1 OmpH family outer membrane protein [Tenacibaculum aquimarinum]MDO6599420.1 OmpH family outer membrane protein [Tenacibaculum sp. 1_MG-2023]
MKKYILSIVLLLTVTFVSAQKYQRIAYIDMEYILENVPAYTEAQNSLNAKVEKWRNRLDKDARSIEVLKTDLSNEKAILTKDLIEEREEDITVQQQELRRLESLYFGPNGDMYQLRKQLIQPVQDQVYNAVQNIASRKKYDFVFDKSGDLVMLFSNKKHDISDLVLKAINIDIKKQTKKEQIEAKKNAVVNKELTEEQQKRLNAKQTLKDKKEQEREAKRQEIEAKRQARIKERDEKRKLLLEKKEALRKAREEAKKKKEAEKEDGEK